MNEDGTAFNIKLRVPFCKGLFLFGGGTMEDWKKALNNFLNKWKSLPFYEGAIACGSYVSGNYNKFSDIDVHIVLKKGNSWRERGNITVDSFLIEYFANPVNKYETEIDEEKYSSKNHTTRMFASGMIIDDVNGEVSKLKEKAVENSDIEMPSISDFELLIGKYACWDKFDELQVIYHENRDSFYLAYYEVYKQLIGFYERVKGFRSISITKLDKILDSDQFRENYCIKEYYNNEEKELIRECMNIDTKEKMMKKINDLYDFVMSYSGGFDINKFVLRSDL